jgi:shikimate kinase
MQGRGDNRDIRENREPQDANIILMGAMGSGKSTVGWLLAKLLGFGFFDLDAAIEETEKKPVHLIFEEKGETYFRDLERETLKRFSGLRNHVISLGGGAVSDDENWELINRIGATVWLNPPPDEIARRLSASPELLQARPLLAELANHKDAETRHKLLSERISALTGNRVGRYKQARIVISDRFSTPDSTARLLLDTLIKEGIVRLVQDSKPFDKWRIL